MSKIKRRSNCTYKNHIFKGIWYRTLYCTFSTKITLHINKQKKRKSTRNINIQILMILLWLNGLKILDNPGDVRIESASRKLDAIFKYCFLSRSRSKKLDSTNPIYWLELVKSNENYSVRQ